MASDLGEMRSKLKESSYGVPELRHWDTVGTNLALGHGPSDFLSQQPYSFPLLHSSRFFPPESAASGKDTAPPQKSRLSSMTPDRLTVQLILECRQS